MTFRPHIAVRRGADQRPSAFSRAICPANARCSFQVAGCIHHAVFLLATTVRSNSLFDDGTDLPEEFVLLGLKIPPRLSVRGLRRSGGTRFLAWISVAKLAKHFARRGYQSSKTLFLTPGADQPAAYVNTLEKAEPACPRAKAIVAGTQFFAGDQTFYFRTGAADQPSSHEHIL